eukprot:TRINITY_DN3177_c0_g1_i1.p1 TRINITY_DN3177_c0_g1~~TRINITY_DN3177_c0_g1_i1.p1  ORF type:complete len:489 (+),score=74.37 TRINITY_DN3177_c0_g1_i1:21-1487(+)
MSNSSRRRFDENPFGDHPVPQYPYPIQLIKNVFCYTVLLPIRIVHFLLTLVIAFIGFKIITFGCDLRRPLTPKRQKMVCFWMSWCARSVLFAFGYYWIKVNGSPVRSARDAPIAVANHMSLVDGFLLVYLMTPSFVAKAEVTKYPILGSLITGINCILVDRTSVNSKTETLEAIISRANQSYSEGEPDNPLLIFPEGTTTNGKCMISFKNGAFIPGTPVQPICIKYPFNQAHPSFTINNGTVTVLRRLLTQFYNRAEVTFLEPYVPSEAEKKDPSLFANNVRQLMATELGTNTTDHSYEDVLLQMEAIRQNEPADQFNIEFGALKDLYSLDLKSTKELLQKFAEHDTLRVGEIDLEEFAHLLGLPMTDRIVELFNIFDSDCNGTIGFKEFILGISILNQREDATKRDIIQHSFNIFDLDEDGYVSFDEFKMALQATFPTISKDEIEAIFNSMDIDKDGRASYEEFFNYSMEHPEYIALAESELRKRNN